MQERLFKELKTLGIKLAQVENDLKMPQRYLSKFKNPKNILPSKWIEPLESYIKKLQGVLPEKVTDTPKREIETLPPKEEPKKKQTPVAEEPKPAGLRFAPTLDALARLKVTMDKINKDFGPGSIMCLGDEPMKDIEVVSSGSVGLDRALGIGGFPKGRITEIYGPNSCGKTTIALHVIAEAQKAGANCALVDAEHAFDATYARAIGVDVEKLKISQPDYGEQGLEEADRLILTGSIGVIVIDSVAALVPRGELEAQMGVSTMGLHARLMSQAMRKMTASISRTETACIFINQLRQKIGVVYGSLEFTPGGEALKYYSSVRVDVRIISKILDGDVPIGNRVRAKVIKNKCAPPYKTAEFDIIYGEGINRIGEVVDLAVENGVIEKNGSWFSYGSDKLGQGRANVTSILKDNEGLYLEIVAKLNKDKEGVKELP